MGRSLMSSILLKPIIFTLLQIDRAVARAGVDDRLADRFPDRAAPAGVERAHDLPAGVRGRPGGQPERVGAGDSGKVDFQVCHESDLSLRATFRAAGNFVRLRARPSHASRPRAAAMPSATASTTSLAAVGAVAAREIFRIAGLVPLVDFHRAVFVDLEAVDGAQQIR